LNIAFIFGPGNNYTDSNGNSGTFTYSYDSGLLSLGKWAVASYQYEGESYYYTNEMSYCFTTASGSRLHILNSKKTEGDFSSPEGTYVVRWRWISDYLNPNISDRDDYLDATLNFDNNGTYRTDVIQTGSIVNTSNQTGTWTDNGDNTYTTIVTDPPESVGDAYTRRFGWILHNGFWYMISDNYYSKQ